MKRMTAKELLAESFRELAAAKPIDKITIKEIVDNCGYSPATFYRQFKDKYDLVAWDYTRKIDAIMNRIGQDGYTLKEALTDAAEYFCSQREYLSNLFLHTNGLESFIGYMREIHYNGLVRTVLRVTERGSLDEMMAACIRLYVLGTVQYTCEWVTGNNEADPKKLAEVYDLSMPEMLRKFEN